MSELAFPVAQVGRRRSDQEASVIVEVQKYCGTTATRPVREPRPLPSAGQSQGTVTRRNRKNGGDSQGAEDWKSSASLTLQDAAVLTPQLMRRQMRAQRFSDLAGLRDAATGLLPRHRCSRALPKLLAGRSRSTWDVSRQAPRVCGRGRPGLTASSALASIGARASQRGGTSSRGSNVVLESALLGSWRRPLKPSEASHIACGGCIGLALPTATKTKIAPAGRDRCAA